jgi:hypothetical protein
LPFAERRLALVAEFSALLGSDKRFAENAPLRAFAFWTRKSALLQLRDRFLAQQPQQTVAVGRGIAFHLPPANVDTLFLYSWALAFLTGNVNVTRLPSAFEGPSEAALALLLSLLEKAGFADAFVSYPANEGLNRALSQLADIRIVWGGDAKAEIFAAIPLRADARALVFPDRFSYAAIDGAFLLGLDDEGRKETARALFNDLFLFNQMACSSPHLLYVVGDAVAHGPALQNLLAETALVAEAKGVNISASHALEKDARAASLAGAGNVTRIWRFSNDLTSVALTESLDPAIGGGFLGIVFIDALDALAAQVQERHQTLTYAGFTREDMEVFAPKAALRGLCRIVPMGQALAFDALWDGQDLLRETVKFVRII